MKRVIQRLAILMALILALTGCGTGDPGGQGSSPSAELYDKQVVLAAARDLTPGEKDGYYTSLITQVWEPLVTLGQDGTPQPALATKWSMSQDGKEWTISLREGVTFHDF